MWKRFKQQLKKANFNDPIVDDEDLADMFDMFGGGGGDPEPSQDPSATDDPPAAEPEVPVSDPPADPVSPAAPVDPEPVVTEPPADSAPATEPPTDDPEPEPAVDDDTDVVAALRAQLEALSAKMAEMQSATPAKPKDDDPSSAGDPGTGAQDFLGELDIDDVVSKPELFNQVLNTAVQNVLEQVTAQFQHLVGAIPTIVQPAIRQTISMENQINQFYEEHPLLANFKQVVGTVADEVQAADPQAAFATMLPKIAEKAYAYLKLDPTAVAQAVSPKPAAQTPALPSASRSRNPSPAPSGNSLEQEIADLL